MELIEEMRKSHRKISPQFEALMERVLADPDGVTHIQREGLNKMAFLYPMNAWPLLGDDRFKREVAEATETVMDLCCLLPERVFLRDLEATAEMFGYASVEVAEQVFREPNGLRDVMCRPDFLLTEDGFKCLETNVSPQLGGAFTNLWVDEYKKLPHLASFLGEKNLDPLHMDARDTFFQIILDLTENLRTDKTLSVGLIANEMPEVPFADIFNKGIGRYIEQVGLDIIPNFLLTLPYPQGIKIQDGYAHAVDSRLHMMLGDIPPEKAVMDLFREGKLTMLNAPAGDALTDKRCLALLSEKAESGLFSPAEAEKIKRYIPWTRLLQPSKTSYKGKTHDLLELVNKHPEQFVIKCGYGFKGEQVKLGGSCSGRDWSAAVDEAVKAGNWIVQEKLQSIPFLGMGEDRELCPHQLVWGFFCFRSKFVGTFLRSQPIGGGKGIVNSASGASESLLLFI